MTGAELRAFLLEAVRPEILNYYNAQSCVATTKVACEVLTWAGVKNRPLPCRLLVTNDIAKDLIIGDQVPTHDDVQAMLDAGGHAVEVAGTDRWANGGWDGHLVVTARFDDGDYLLDLSLDQARRPVWQINVHPVAAMIPEFPLTQSVITRVADSWVAWAPIRSNSFRSHNDWKLDDLTGPIAGTLIRELRLEREEQADAVRH